MSKKLFLLDGMALVYRAHFALIARPIFTSKGVNTSALYGFTQTLLEIIRNQQPTHLAVAFDTDAPTQRHVDYAEYKSQRQTMPEDLSLAMPHVRRMIEAFNIPILICDGYEADDIIGTLAKKAEKEDFMTYMVTPDKDFGQVVSKKVFLYKPSRMGDAVEILGLPEILQKWGIQRAEQVIDIMGLWGDTSDNIPGVPGIGEKTASKLISQYGSIENLLAHTGELKGKLKETLETHRDDALLSKRLASLDCNTPCDLDLENLRVRKPNDEAVKALLVEFEFNSIGKRLYGDDFRAGRGFAGPTPVPKQATTETDELVLVGETVVAEEKPSVPLTSLADVRHEYRIVESAEDRRTLIQRLEQAEAFSFHLATTDADPKIGRPLGIGFCTAPHEGAYIPLPEDDSAATALLNEFRSVFESANSCKLGHGLKSDLAYLKCYGIETHGTLFDTMLAHSLIEPDMRHGIDYLAEACFGYSLAPRTEIAGHETDLFVSSPEGDGEKKEVSAARLKALSDQTIERADIAWQLRGCLEPQLKDKGQERVFYEIESKLLPVLVDMEHEGIRIDTKALADFSIQLANEMAEHEQAIYRIAGREFNINSPRQLGEVLFEHLKLLDKPKKTRTGQYSTDEQTLIDLAPDHEIVQRLLDYRTASKLKSTYADTLPGTVWPRTGRVHTTYQQTATATGRLNSQNPNLQNIPIRTEHGREIRRAFVPRDDEHLLLSADYSQIELRIIAALTQEASLLEAFQQKLDIHTATAAKVFGVFLEMVTPDMRRKAKMVNYGISYGISAFGLAQRLRIPRKEAASIIEQYFARFPGVKKYMIDTVAFAQKNGYVETVTGRRRYMRDIRSSNATIRGSAERNAINAPIQGSAADMIKIAMIEIHRELRLRNLKTRMLLQVHDELVFDLRISEKEKVLPLVEEKMKNAIKLPVPIEIELGVGKNWLEAH
jgi:DNA polymerase I